MSSGSVINGLPNAVLLCNTGTWTSDTTVTYTYQWTTNGANIAGATASTYTTGYTDGFKLISCILTVTNSIDDVTVAASNGYIILINGFVSLSAEFGFGPIQYVSTVDSTNTTLTESASVPLSSNVSAVVGDGFSDLTKQTLSIISGNITVAESASILVAATTQRVLSDGYSNLANTAVIPSMTYAYSDGIPVIVSNAAPASSTQTWYMG